MDGSPSVVGDRRRRQRRRPHDRCPESGTHETTTQIGGSSVWETYKDLVRTHRVRLDVLDDALSRLLFWLPHSESSGGSEDWREVGYGILSLHRLSMHLALQQDEYDQRTNAYGTSVRTRNAPTIAATSVRIALTAIHSVLPALTSLAMLVSSSKPNRSDDSSDNNDVVKRQNLAGAAARVRLRIEQVKFLLRVYLLAFYWRQQHNGDDDDEDGAAADCGVLMNGGMYRVEDSQEFLGIPWDKARALQRRRDYVGERTGWNAAKGDNSHTTKGFWKTILLLGGHNNARVMAADFLYTLRPLLWAWFEWRFHRPSSLLPSPKNHHHPNQYHHRTYAHHRTNNTLGSYLARILLGNKNGNDDRHKTQQLWRGWILCLAMDLVSIRLLDEKRGKQSRSRTDNPCTTEEIRRRKMRLLLYALRSPVWSRGTLPILDTVVSRGILQKIPLLGGVFETVLWDWILYYQHPFVSEEG